MKSPAAISRQLFRRTDGTLLLFLMDGPQLLAAQFIGNVGTEWRLVGVGDLSADARADMVFRRTDGMLAVILMDGFQVQSAELVGSVAPEWRTCYGEGLGGVTRVGQQ